MDTIEKEHDTAAEAEKALSEFAKLIDLAERLDEKCEAIEQRLENLAILRTGIYLLGFAMVATLVFSFVTEYPIIGTEERLRYYYCSLGLRYLPLIGALFFGGGVLYALKRASDRMRQNLTRDKRAHYKIVDTLRDVEKAVADQNNLSPLERLEFRTRLSRFGIGPGR